ncbi:Hypothetical protein R9X50_00458600 [Acrodontium crateriforme]|uniref:Uncharacterized protein n=1 Tax=Acrodontium crateriforme TaxID=150365 RepID=A0AAQ3M5M3_9PEZI|nr:Hypothetical protein R9X50_00458600 [Acrodontium crateriforme]
MSKPISPDLTSEVNDGEQTTDQLHSAETATSTRTEAPSTATSSAAAKDTTMTEDMERSYDASDSELSTPGVTPEPPSPLLRDLRRLRQRRVFDCRCEGSCRCAVRSYYRTRTIHLHLGSWALNSQIFPESALRSTIGR